MKSLSEAIGERRREKENERRLAAIRDKEKERLRIETTEEAIDLFVKLVEQREGIATTRNDWMAVEVMQYGPNAYTFFLRRPGSARVGTGGAFRYDKEKGVLVPVGIESELPFWRESINGTYSLYNTLPDACLAAGFGE